MNESTPPLEKEETISVNAESFGELMRIAKRKQKEGYFLEGGYMRTVSGGFAQLMSLRSPAHDGEFK